MKNKTILKIDLDLNTKKKSIDLLTERLKFFNQTKILLFSDIENIILIKKKNFSVKIYLKKEIKSPEIIILFQSMLGDDYKRTAITIRDLILGIRNFNRMFDGKLYVDGKFKFSKEINIYLELSERINKKSISSRSK